MKILYPIALGIALFALIPLTVAIPVPPEKETTSLGSTMVRGIILHLRSVNMGHDLTFRAVWVHYRTHYFSQQSDGVLHGFQLVTMKNDYYGLVRNHFIWARFDGTINIG
jgi:hypothetical protein